MGIRLTHLSLALAPFFVLDGPLRPDTPKGIEPGIDQEPERQVDAGVVRWHPDFAAARAAAEVSGKPILLFQLLGRLDEERC